MDQNPDKSKLIFRIYIVSVSALVILLLSGIIPYDLGQSLLNLRQGNFFPQNQEFLDIMNLITVVYFLGALLIVGLAAAVSLGTRDGFEVLALFMTGMLPRERKQWGKVFDQQTKQPLAFEPVRIYLDSQATPVLVAEARTDADGRYRLSFKGQKGQKYTLQVSDASYKPYTYKLEDYLLTGEQDIVNDIPLQKLESADNSFSANFYRSRTKYYWTLLRVIYVIYFLLLIMMIVFMIDNPLFGNLIALLVVLTSVLWNTRILLGHNEVLKGKVMTNVDHKPLPGATVDLIVIDGHSQVVADADGVPRFAVQAGVYRGTVKSPGYTMLGVDTQGYKLIKIGKEGYATADMLMAPMSEAFKIDPRSVIGA